MRKALALALTLSALPAMAFAGLGDIHPTELPSDLIAATDTVTLRWDESVQCQLWAGSDPGQPDLLIGDLISLPGLLSFTPATGGLGPGAWFAQLVASGGGDSSLPFVLFVEAATAPVMVSPQNGGVLPPGSVRLSWEPVLGVPYYHVILSDQEIQIDEDENGETVIAGANIIWQAIVAETGADYGSWDPSGFFNETNGTPPPLVPGPEYNWLVLNNYGNNPALTSTRQAGVSSFTVFDDGGLDPPQLIAPADGDSLAAATITFAWTEVPEANHYHFTLSRIVDSDDSEGAIGVFDQVTGQTLLDLPATSLLVASRYLWKVFALDATGQGVASETFEFHYSIAMGRLAITTRDEAGAALPHVQVELIPLGGGGNALPIVTGSGGGWDDDLVPGDYQLAASKDGYEDSAGAVTVIADAESTLALTLSMSPATFSGEVRNAEQVPVPFATVSAVKHPTGEVREVQCGASGAFQLGVSAGSWTLSAAKAGHHSGGDIAADAEPGGWHALEEPLVLLPNSGFLGGLVLGESGQPIVTALVTVSGDGGTQQVLTGSDGAFQFNLDAGTWTLTAAKPGFVSPPPRTVLIAADEDISLDPPLVLGAEAALVSGFVFAGGGVVGGATVQAVPASGSPVAVECGPQGDWQLSLAAGSWNLSARRDGYSAADTVQVNLVPGTSQSGLNLTMIANPSTVSGRVSDGQDALAGAIVSAGGAATTSAWDGLYTLSLPAGPQVLEAWFPGYSSPAPLVLDLSPGQDLSGIDFVLSPNAATLSGHVNSEGAPVAAATLHLLGEGIELSRTSGADGAYSISVAPGDYLLWARKDGMGESDTLTIACGPGQSLPGRDFELLPAAARLFGSVAGGGEALRDAELRAESALGVLTTHSDFDGAWSLLVPAGAEWQIEVSRSGYHGAEAQTPPLGDGASWSHDFDLALQVASLRGTVRDENGAPIAGATLLALGQGSTESDGQGAFELGLEPGALVLDVSCPGYASSEEHLALAIGINTFDPMLASRFASLSGTVRDEGGEPLADVFLACAGGSAFSDEAGEYLFPRLVAGELTVSAELAGYAATVELMSLGESEAAQQDFTLAVLTGSLAGRVIDADGLPLSGALLQVRDGGAVLAQGYSAEDGAFAISGLPVDRPLSLGASLAAHAALVGNPLESLWPPLADLELGLSPLDGIIAGTVRDASTDLPIPGAELEADDGAGYFGQAISDAEGRFVIDGLRRGVPYAVAADAPGWAATALASVLPGESDLTLLLPSAAGSIVGSLQPDRTDSELSLPDDLRLRGVPGAAGAAEQTVLIDSFGDFELSGLPPGDYTLLFQVDNHLTEPRSLFVTLAEGETAGPFEFALIAAPIDALSIGGVSELDNDASAVFQSSQSTAEGEQVQYPLFWSLSPTAAGTLDAESGRFTPRSGFFGDVELFVVHAATGLAANKTVSIFARLASGEAHELDDGRGLGLSIPSGALLQDSRITVRRREASPLKRRAGGYRVEGDIFRLLPDGLTFASESLPTLGLPIPNPLFNAGLAMGWWSPSGLRWERLEAEKSAAGLLSDLEHFSDYALLVANTALAVNSARVTPNPFSPAQGGAEIRFTLSSQIMAAPIVDVTIYNLLGDPVRRLLEHEALPVGSEQILVWDGLTEAGELARNGRYLVRIAARDGDGEKETILQAVLIK